MIWFDLIWILATSLDARHCCLLRTSSEWVVTGGESGRNENLRELSALNWKQPAGARGHVVHDLRACWYAIFYRLQYVAAAAVHLPSANATSAANSLLFSCHSIVSAYFLRAVPFSVRENVCNNSKNRKKSCFLEIWKNVKYEFSNTGSFLCVRVYAY